MFILSYALKNIFNIEQIRTKEDKKRLEDEKWLEKLDIPCWFVENLLDESHGNKWTSRNILVDYGHDKDLLESPSENSYKEIYYKGENNEFKFAANIEQDYGIFARLTKDDYHYVIIAGIHQYGTWIVASLLNDLLCNRNVEYNSTYLSGEDFIAVIWGRFDNKKLKVDSESVDVYKKYIWTKKTGGEWVHANPDSKSAS